MLTYVRPTTRRRLELFRASHRGRDMKFVTGLLAVGLLLADLGASHAGVRISGDRGGRIETYLNKFMSLGTSGETVIIDGLCLSACTIVLGSVPHDNICVTSRATLGFHAAYDFGTNRRTITNREATQQLYSMYPMPVQNWITERGGLTPHMIFLRGKALQAMYRPCDLGEVERFGHSMTSGFRRAQKPLGRAHTRISEAGG